jgi:hypothetical protein
MTLVLTALTEHEVIQVSDRRFTYVKGGSVVRRDDEKNKAVLFCGRLMFGFTGLGELGVERQTDLWLAGRICDVIAEHDQPGDQGIVLRFTPETLATQHAQYLTRRGEPTDERAARDLLEAHSEYDLVPENLAKPRIVLLASSFPPVVTATAVWLTEMSLDITLKARRRLRGSRHQSCSQARLRRWRPGRGSGRSAQPEARASADHLTARLCWLNRQCPS